GVGMPGPYSSEHSVRDARIMAERLGVCFKIIPIGAAFEASMDQLTPAVGGRPSGVTEENLQSRLRGITLMALSNQTGALVLTTGNKSELAVGYCTLYGDMCGGLAVTSDVPKTMVYQLCRVANWRLNNAIPEEVFTKPPSAELRPDQKDTDSLPEYDVLDRILRAYIEEDAAPASIADSLGLDIRLAREIVHKVDPNENKAPHADPRAEMTRTTLRLGP